MGEFGTAGIAWSELPKDVQHKVLMNLGVQDLCRMRCVCREWRDVIHRRDFRGMYDVANSSQEPRPVICYLESSYPIRLVCTAYDYEGRMWKKMNSFPSIPQRYLTAINSRVRYDRYWPPLQIGLYSVGGLLCLHRWSFHWGHVSTRVVSSWTVWNPFRNRWKKLPLCKYEVSGQQFLLPDTCVHAFVSDERTKAYKILMALHHVSNDFEGSQQKLTTRIYDSRTGIWTDGAEHTLGVHLYHLSSVKGLHYNGLVYFLAEHWPDGGPIGYNRPSVYLTYDIGEDEWIEQPVDSYLPIFEWDGRLMTVEYVENALLGNEKDFIEWEPVSGTWKDTGIKMPGKIFKVFQHDLGGISIVASGNHLAVTGLTENDEFRIAVYKRAENYWRMPPTGKFSNKLSRSLVKGLVLHTPSLDWRP
ncbi:hypothetical protein M758_5G132800 [Ceratodon purpureus]|nr:hypothetical protein M758_5G132800 [Ceratodon purpureus]